MQNWNQEEVSEALVVGTKCKVTPKSSIIKINNILTQYFKNLKKIP